MTNNNQETDSTAAREASVTATWVIELNCECPECHESVNLIDYEEFWDQHHRYLEIAERKQGLEVVCPDCGHEFQVNCEY